MTGKSRVFEFLGRWRALELKAVRGGSRGAAGSSASVVCGAVAPVLTICSVQPLPSQTGFTDDGVTGPVKGQLINCAGPDSDFCLFLAALCCFWLEEVYTKAAPTDVVIQRQLSVNCAGV